MRFTFGKEELDDIYHLSSSCRQEEEINDEDLRILSGEVFSGESPEAEPAGNLRKISHTCCNHRNKDKWGGPYFNGFGQHSMLMLYSCKTPDKQNYSFRRVSYSGYNQR
jgi:hypothetical protein